MMKNINWHDFETVDDAIKALDDLRMSILCQDETEIFDVLPPMAQEFYGQTLDHLNLALRNLRLAHYHNMQGK